MGILIPSSENIVTQNTWITFTTNLCDDEFLINSLKYLDLVQGPSLVHYDFLRAFPSILL